MSTLSTVPEPANPLPYRNAGALSSLSDVAQIEAYYNRSGYIFGIVKAIFQGAVAG